MIKHICIFFSVLFFLNFPIFGQNIYKAKAGLELVPLVESFLYKNSYYVEANGKYQFLNKTFFNLGGGIARRELDNGYRKFYNTEIQGYFIKFGVSRNFLLKQNHSLFINLRYVLSIHKAAGSFADYSYLSFSDTIYSFNYSNARTGSYEIKFGIESNLSERLLLNTGFFVSFPSYIPTITLSSGNYYYTGPRISYLPGFRQNYESNCSLGLSIVLYINIGNLI